MSKSSNTAPIFDPVVDDNGKANLSWVLFFNSLYEGDIGTLWTPTFQNLTEVGGSASISGKYYRIGRRLCYFRLTVTPVTNTSSTAGTTYIDNFPLTSTNDGVCFAVSGTLGGSLGIVNSGNNRIYVPSWSAVTAPVTVVGIVEVAS